VNFKFAAKLSSAVSHVLSPIPCSRNLEQVHNFPGDFRKRIGFFFEALLQHGCRKADRGKILANAIMKIASDGEEGYIL
jgi:hypothetical protein